MSKHPVIYALCASGYIVGVVSIINSISRMQMSKPDTILAPIVALSLLTLSVTVMAYLFFYQPLQLFIAGKKKEAVLFFTHTVGSFAFFTVLAVLLLFSGLIQ